MKAIADFNILENIGESFCATVYKVKHKKQDTGLKVLKLIKPEYRFKGLAESLKQQIQQISCIYLPQTLVPDLYHTRDGEIFLIQDFFPGFNLDQWRKSMSIFHLSAILNVAVAITKLLIEKHAAGHIHKAVKPANILINPETLEIRLIDDVHVLDMNQLSHFIFNEYFRSHTLPYISPEQTGRIRHTIDYTSDLYSFGIVLYELLAEKTPFTNNDPLGIIHSHLAETPQSLIEIDSSIPVQLDKIIFRLLHKLPEKRYQTAKGLQYDLEQTLKALQMSDESTSFELGSQDFSNRITIPSIMVGRDAQKEQLLKEHSLSCKGEFRGAIISGFSGVGKTRLIQELQLPVVASRSYYTSGKFDQYQKRIPYSTLIQAIRYLIRIFLTEEKERIAYWKQRFLDATDKNGQLLIDIIPEIELITGPQPEVFLLPPLEAQNRFNITAGRFLSSLADKKHPLTLFIDDLQWCDSATFDFIEMIFDNIKDYPYIFFIGAFRHNEIDKNQRLAHLIAKIKSLKKKSLLEINLEPLGSKDVNKMTAYILNTNPVRTFELSNVIYKISGGNPLFVNESLHWLYDRQYLWINEKGVWDWNNDQIQHCNIPESAQNLFTDKIISLSEKCIKLLEIGSCLGTSFTDKALAQVAEIKIDALYDLLKEAFAQNILKQGKSRIEFFHDQIQAAVNNRLSTEKKRKMHAKIAESMIAATPKGTDIQTLENLFQIVEHLANGRSADQTVKQKIRESQFNYHAGRIAAKSQALDNAYHFFKKSIELYPHNIWEDDYDFLFSLHKKFARVAMSTGRQTESEKAIELLLKKAKTDLDKAECLAEQTSTLSSLGDTGKSIKTGNQVLAYFNKEILHDDELAMEKAGRLFKQIHKGDNDVWQKILNMEQGFDRALKIEIFTYSELIPNYYTSGMTYQVYLTALQSVSASLNGCVDDSVIYSLAIAGLYAQTNNLPDIAHKYEDLVIAMADKYSDTFGATRGMNALIWVHLQNRKNSRFIIEQSWRNIHQGKICGDLLNTGFTYASCLWTMIAQGEDFDKITDVANECIDFSEKYNLSLVSSLGKSILLGWSDGMIINKKPFNKKKINKIIKSWENDKYIASIASYYILNGMALYFSGQYEKAKDLFKKSESYLSGLNESLLYRLWYVFTYLCTMKCVKDSPEILKTKEFLQITGYCLERVETWTGFGPLLKPYLFLMKMEHARSFKDFSETRRFCLDGIDSANEQGYIFLEGYFNECLGEMLNNRQKVHAGYHLAEAARIYNSCKARIMEKRITVKFDLHRKKTANIAVGEETLDKMLNFNYLLNSVKAITGELNFNRLLKIIIESVMAKLGAKTGYLLIAEKDGLIPCVSGIKKEKVIVNFKDEPDFSINKLSMGIARYVFHTNNMVILNDAFATGEFIADDIVQKQKLCSVLCLPIIKQKKTLGVLYLENSLIKSVFTAEQVELASLLTGQAAIALQNAGLLQEMKDAHETINSMNKNLEQRVIMRTKELNIALEELKDFAYVISHDLKAPLRGITQLVSWILEDYNDKIDEDGQEMFTLLQSRTKRMHDMIEGILNYSRVGRINEPDKDIDLNELVKNIIDLLALPEAISFRILNRLPVIRCDNALISQIFQNLFDNAAKYMDKEKGEISIGCVEENGFWKFCIADNGPGIDKKYQQKIFHLFQTLKPKDETDSTGIGLAIVKKIIHTLKGRIWLESENKIGTSFFFTIPKK